jgi:hypothetical protein
MDGEKDAAVTMNQAPSRMEKRIHLRFHAPWTGQRTQKASVKTTLKETFASQNAILHNVASSNE